MKYSIYSLVAKYQQDQDIPVILVKSWGYALLYCANRDEQSWAAVDHFSRLNDEQISNKVGVVRTNQTVK